MNLRIIPTRVHGYLDYISGALMPFVPRIFGWDRRVARLHEAIAAGSVGQSLFTDYELGVVRAWPMWAHLSVDGVAGCLLLGSGALMTDEPTSARVTMAGAGLFLLVAAFTTQTRTPEQQAEERAAQLGQRAERYAEQPGLSGVQKPGWRSVAKSGQRT